MQLDTENTVYICTDRDNAQVKLLLPKRLAAWMKENKMDLQELKLSDPNPESTDSAEYKLISEEMDEHTFDV